MKIVKVIPAPIFNNIDKCYDVGLNKPLSLHEFMTKQLSAVKTVPIDMNNGGFKVKGTKIMVMPQYFSMAKSTFEEFH
jgi:hypothetical protein